MNNFKVKKRENLQFEIDFTRAYKKPGLNTTTLPR